MRLVLDTNIAVSGLLWGGVPRRLLELARTGHIALFTSSVLLDELADVLARDKFAALLAAQKISPTFLMHRYGLLAQLVKPQALERTVRDADDDVVIATALAAHADVIVTGDHDLLILHPYRDIQILNPAKAVRMLGEQT